MGNASDHYFLGLDIGTDSVGYAATSTRYDLLKCRGTPLWGTTTFEAADLAEQRRINRTARRRLDRRQQRVQLLEELFAAEICKNDPNFFIRRRESALFLEDTQYGVQLFNDQILERKYHQQYPTIHHLIFELMTSNEPHDIRLIYQACAWLVSHRGHFLLEIDAEQVGAFQNSYSRFLTFLHSDDTLQWPDSVSGETIQEIMQAEGGVKAKEKLFKEKVFDEKTLTAKSDSKPSLSKEKIVGLLSGRTVSPSDLFCNDAYKGVESISLGMDEESFDVIMNELGDDAELLRAMRAMNDCVLLNKILRGKKCISEAKIEAYEQHRADLAFLKYCIRKYRKEEYNKVFRYAGENNYVAYSGNFKDCNATKTQKEGSDISQGDKKKTFCAFIRKIMKEIEPEEADKAKFQDMMNRLELNTFLPKQKDSDNRVIPYQLYERELCEILSHARKYLPMLLIADEDGITNEEKILAIFRFRIPYFVGPLNAHSPHGWLERKAGRIFPWNFEKMVDLDVSEQRFIQKMTNTCTYLPGEAVLPYCSLLYSKFMTLNELNNLKVNQIPIPVLVKQELYTALFVNSQKRVTLKLIKGYLMSHGYISAEDTVSGVDEILHANLKTYHSFGRLVREGYLSETQVEDIVQHAAYSEDKNRMRKWLSKQYPALSEEDCKYILRLNLKEFGRLSRLLLTGIKGCAVNGTGEAMSIIDALWLTQDNLMQLLSERYTFREQIEGFSKDYYTDPENKQTLLERLDSMYVSNPVKRQIIRTLDICADVVKATGHQPERIFVEMARGGAVNSQRNRTPSRSQQIIELYKKVNDEDVPRLQAELKAMGDMVDNRLQSDRLFLYYMQLGKCMYSGEPIQLGQLASAQYDIDHIYPQSKVQDDSVLNNKVLCLSTENGAKRDQYPIKKEIQDKMRNIWAMLKENHLITEEKYRRLIRKTGFTEDELHQFINRQLVETRQASKVVTQLLKERYPASEIVYVKAGMVSQFRQEFDMLKCRSVNDLHHAKDAYLNIVVGNVYYEKFTRRWFDVKQDYTLNLRPLFEHSVKSGDTCVWCGGEDLANVRKQMLKNAVHLTRYAFQRKGGLFNQLPCKAGEGLVPRKAGMPTEKYGGYNKSTASYYLLAAYRTGKKKDVIFAPVELMYAAKIQSDPMFAQTYIADAISKINGGKPVTEVKILLEGRPIKINAVISLDGMLVTLRGKSDNGKQMSVSSHIPLIVGYETERYIKRLEQFIAKQKENANLNLDAAYDHITAKHNIALYRMLTEKMRHSIFAKCPGNILKFLENGSDSFAGLQLKEQVQCLMEIVSWFEAASTIDLTLIGGGKQAGSKRLNAKLSNIAKSYRDVRIIDMSASGLFVSRSENLLNLL